MVFPDSPHMLSAVNIPQYDEYGVLVVDSEGDSEGW